MLPILLECQRGYRIFKEYKEQKNKITDSGTASTQEAAYLETIAAPSRLLDRMNGKGAHGRGWEDVSDLLGA